MVWLRVELWLVWKRRGSLQICHAMPGRLVLSSSSTNRVSLWYVGTVIPTSLDYRRRFSPEIQDRLSCCCLTVTMYKCYCVLSTKRKKKSNPTHHTFHCRVKYTQLTGNLKNELFPKLPWETRSNGLEERFILLFLAIVWQLFLYVYYQYY